MINEMIAKLMEMKNREEEMIREKVLAMKELAAELLADGALIVPVYVHSPNHSADRSVFDVVVHTKKDLDGYWMIAGYYPGSDCVTISVLENSDHRQINGVDLFKWDPAAVAVPTGYVNPVCRDFWVLGAPERGYRLDDELRELWPWSSSDDE